MPTIGEDDLVFFEVLEDVPDALDVLRVLLVVCFVTLLDLLCKGGGEYIKHNTEMW